MKPVVMLPKKYKSRAAAQRAADAMGRKLGVSVGAQLAASALPKRKKSKAKRGPKRNASGRFVKRSKNARQKSTQR